MTEEYRIIASREAHWTQNLCKDAIYETISMVDEANALIIKEEFHLHLI